MEVTIQKPDGTVTYVSGTSEEIKDFFGVTDLPKSSYGTEGLAPGLYAVTDGWTPDHLNTGQYYKVLCEVEKGTTIRNNDGDYLDILWSGCANLNGGNWRKVVVE